ncbi:MAG: hypothetical protein AAFX02_11800 [Pseudomonadota bacterium]
MDQYIDPLSEEWIDYWSHEFDSSLSAMAATVLLAVHLVGFPEDALAELVRNSDINFKDRNGETALFYASTASMAEYLLKAGCDRSIRNKDGSVASETHLQRAEQHLAKHLEISGDQPDKYTWAKGKFEAHQKTAAAINAWIS